MWKEKLLVRQTEIVFAHVRVFHYLYAVNQINYRLFKQSVNLHHVGYHPNVKSMQVKRPVKSVIQTF